MLFKLQYTALSLWTLSLIALLTNNKGLFLVSSTEAIEETQDSQIDEATLLDVFGEVTKDYLTHRLIPDTDLECDWNWKHARCEPFCKCSFQGSWGDYTLGRACRLQKHYKEDAVFDLGQVETDEFRQLVSNRSACYLPPETPYILLFETLLNGSKKIGSRSKLIQEVKEITKKFDIKGKIGHARIQFCANLLEYVQVSNEDSILDKHKLRLLLYANCA